MQEEIGLQAATDGEFRRTSWHMDFIYQLGGITKTDEQIRVRMRNAEGEGAFTSAGLAVTGKVRLERPIFADAFASWREQTTTAVPKLTIPSPSMVHYRGGTAAIDKGVYPDVEEFWATSSAAYADEVARARASSAAATSSSTTPASRTSTTRRSGRRWPRRARTPTTSTCATSSRSTRPSRDARPI